MPRFLSVDPNSPEWLKCRIGLITASRLKDVMDYTAKGEPTAKRKGYLMELVAERLTGRATEHYVSPEMQFGLDYEPMARAAYEVALDVMVDHPGFALHPTFDFSGASPDAICGTDGGLEIKVPKTETYIGWRMADVIPKEHVPQMVWNMVCCECKYWDFMAFDPRLPEGMRSFWKRLEWDQELVDKYTAEVVKFEGEINQILANLCHPQNDLQDKLRASVAEHA